MQHSSVRQLWCLTNTLFRVRNVALTLRDVKNEATSGDVHENKGDADKMSTEKPAFYTKMHQLHHNRQQSSGLFCRKCTDYAINRGEGGPLELALRDREGSRKVGGGTGSLPRCIGVPPVTVMARMAMLQGSAHGDVARTPRCWGTGSSFGKSRKPQSRRSALRCSSRSGTAKRW